MTYGVKYAIACILLFFVSETICQPNPVPDYVLEELPHDPDAFCQGLIFHSDGYLYEGTGLRGKSSLRKVHGPSGTVLEKVDLPSQYFGEGITIFNDKIYQLTWQSGKGFIYNVAGLQKLGEFDIKTTAPNNEGWGLTHDSESLIVSDGTSTIYFWDPETFEIKKQIEVTDSLSGTESVKVDQLNELEYVPSANEIYANIWRTKKIARINADTGAVIGYLDFADLKPEIAGDVLNCIARVPHEGSLRLFITGKLWGSAYIIDSLAGEPTGLEFAGLETGNTTTPPTTSSSEGGGAYAFLLLGLIPVSCVCWNCT